MAGILNEKESTTKEETVLSLTISRPQACSFPKMNWTCQGASQNLVIARLRIQTRASPFHYASVQEVYDTWSKGQISGRAAPGSFKSLAQASEGRPRIMSATESELFFSVCP